MVHCVVRLVPCLQGPTPPAFGRVAEVAMCRSDIPISVDNQDSVYTQCSLKRPPQSAALVCNITKQNWDQFLLIVKATALKQQISNFYPQIQRTDASDHNDLSQWPVVNVKASFCAQNLRTPYTEPHRRLQRLEFRQLGTPAFEPWYMPCLLHSINCTGKLFCSQVSKSKAFPRGHPEGCGPAVYGYRE